MCVGDEVEDDIELENDWRHDAQWALFIYLPNKITPRPHGFVELKQQTNREGR